MGAPREDPPTWACPACRSPNPPGSDSCQVCGAHLHVAESIGGRRPRRRIGPSAPSWGLFGFAVPLAGLVVVSVVEPLVGTAGALVAFGLVQVAAMLPPWTRTKPSFLAGWAFGMALALWGLIGGDPAA